MTEFQKFVIIVFPLGLQGKIWTTILRSQNLSVIWESPDVHIVETLQQLHRQGRPLPDLLMLDTRLRGLNPYALCRWCRHHCPQTKIVLVNGAQSQILPSEQQWARCQGAADLLPCFQRDSLISSAVTGLRLVLDLLGGLPLDQGSLVSTLLKLGFGPRFRSKPNACSIKSKMALMSAQSTLAW
ncbi:MAG: response regulator [Cyanobacteria bacterium Co-bin13]|nr:response regulator [Cyanobacteria bacterium Co-bin13]